jgi:hypothetical protein
LKEDLFRVGISASQSSDAGSARRCASRCHGGGAGGGSTHPYPLAVSSWQGGRLRATLINPLRHVHGVSDNILIMLSSSVLFGASKRMGA